MTPTEEPWTVGRLLSWTVEYLGKHGAENPRLDAEVLLAKARGCRRIDLYTSYGDVASEEIRTGFRELVKRRAQGVPVAYLVGHREFYSLDFEVTPDVLVPRPETEHLVVELLDFVKGRSSEVQQADREDGALPPTGISSEQTAIADVGTGSGVLAVCAARYIPSAKVTAIDISAAAIDVARKNAAKHGVNERIEFIESDLFSGVPQGQLFDAIVSNPPYISTAEMAALPADVREHEPRGALVAGERGTEVIARLIDQSVNRLKSGGLLLIEISPMIAGEVERLMGARAELELLPTTKDLAGLARVARARRKAINDAWPAAVLRAQTPPR